MKSIRVACFLGLSFAASTCFAQNPVPFISHPLVPAAVGPAGPQFTLTVNGGGFVSGSTVNWNGTPLTTTFVSATKLTAVVPAADVSTDGTARVTVVSPSPGGGRSDPALFSITEPTDSLAFRALTVGGVTSPISTVTADFNNDGIADLAVIDQSAAPSCNYQYQGVGSVAILLGNGDGTFTKHSTLCFVDRSGETPQRLGVAGDLNRDGNIDLIVDSNHLEDGDHLDVYYGNGDGTFTTPIESFVARRAAVAATFPFQNIQGIALGDFYSNGQLNTAVSEINTVPVAEIFLLPEYDFLLSNPGGTGAGPLRAGDFNGDGLLDLADNDGKLRIYLNKGNGAFTQLPDVPFGDGAAPIASGDFNGDGIPDVATVHGNSISVLLGNGDGTFTEKTGQPVSLQTNVSLISADVNGDGILDLVVLDSSNIISVYLGNGDGTFQAGQETTGLGDGVIFGDFNGDGRMDLAVTDSVDSTVYILLQGLAYKALVEPPIRADGTSVFSSKRGALAVKFTLSENGVPTCALPPAAISITRTQGKKPRVVVTSSFGINRRTCEYHYNVKPHSLGDGTYRVDISIDGIVVDDAVFTIQ